MAVSKYDDAIKRSSRLVLWYLDLGWYYGIV